jgi:hypothetical protein
MVVLLRIVAFVAGAVLVAWTLLSAIRTLVLPRSAPDQVSRLAFVAVRRVLLALPLRWARSYEQTDRVLAFYAPVGVLALLLTWLAMVLAGYTLMFRAAGAPSWYLAFRDSGSSLLTLGFAPLEGLGLALLAFSEAAIGLTMIALLIAYLPTIYAAFQRRETAVTLLEVRAGQPPSAVEMIARFHRIHGLNRLTDQWRAWETWFADIEESHTSLAALVFLRSPDSSKSWVTAAGAVLDAASLTRAVINIPADAQADLCIRSGYLALRRIADFFDIPYHPAPTFPAQPISIHREEFDEACERLAAGGVPLKADREQAWQDFGGWRVNYDTVLLALAAMITAPPAPWSSDRAPAILAPAFFSRRPRPAGSRKKTATG